MPGIAAELIRAGYRQGEGYGTERSTSRAAAEARCNRASPSSTSGHEAGGMADARGPCRSIPTGCHLRLDRLEVGDPHAQPFRYRGGHAATGLAAGESESPDADGLDRIPRLRGTGHG